MFYVSIITDNVAFCEFSDSTVIELARILRSVAVQLETGAPGGLCRDFNGNMVGEWGIGR